MIAIEKTIYIDDRPVKLAASAAMVRLYTIMMGSDFWDDYNKVINEKSMIVVENMAYVMARHADPTITEPIEEWLAQFSPLGFLHAGQEIVSIVVEDVTSTATAKKNEER